MVKCTICAFPKSFGFAVNICPVALSNCFSTWTILDLSHHLWDHPTINFGLHSAWMICLPFNKKGAPKPRGSYVLLRAARSHCHVAGLLFLPIMNPRVSSLTFHFTPSAFSWVKFPSFRSLFFIPSFLRSFGITWVDQHGCLWTFLNWIHLLSTVLSLCSPYHQLSWHLENFWACHLRKNLSWQLSRLHFHTF